MVLKERKRLGHWGRTVYYSEELAVARESAFTCKFPKPQFPQGKGEEGQMIPACAGGEHSCLWVKEPESVIMGSEHVCPLLSLLCLKISTAGPAPLPPAPTAYLCLPRLFTIQTPLKRWSGTKSSQCFICKTHRNTRDPWRIHFQQFNAVAWFIIIETALPTGVRSKFFTCCLL